MRTICLMGFPLEHSLSPRMQNAAIKQMDWSGVYIPTPVHPDNLPQAMAGFQALSLHGANVTIPHKERIMPYLDALTDEARLVGAVNTVYRKGEKLVGANTDVEGFRRSLAIEEVDVTGQVVTLIGSGGAARAVAVALARQKPLKIVILARRIEVIEALIEDLEPCFPEVEWQAHHRFDALLEEAFSETGLLVNASPVGMFPHTFTSPVSEAQLALLPPGSVVFDLVYNPMETELLKLSHARGLKTISGLGMLAYQGAAALELWTGQEPDVAVMLSELKAALS